MAVHQRATGSREGTKSPVRRGRSFEHRENQGATRHDQLGPVDDRIDRHRHARAMTIKQPVDQMQVARSAAAGTLAIVTVPEFAGDPQVHCVAVLKSRSLSPAAKVFLDAILDSSNYRSRLTVGSLR